MRHSEEFEDQVILSILEELSPERIRESEAGVRLSRIYTEVVGLIPEQLEPVTPAPQVKSRLMAAVEESLHGSSAAEESTGAELPAPVPMAAARRASWPLALAASLALALLGTSGWLFSQLREADAEVVSLSQTLQEVAEENEQAQIRLTAMQAEFDSIKQRFSLVTAEGGEACPLRPMGNDPLQPEASGVLFMTASSKKTYLRVSGLEPLAGGQAYHVWFVTGRGPVKAGFLQPRGDGTLELEPADMPADSRAVVITLEPELGMEQPTGPQILYGDERMRLL